MPDLQPYLARQRLARRGGGGRSGAVPQPRLGETGGGLFAAQRAIAQEVGAAAETLATVNAQARKARDAAQMAQAEGALTEQLGLAYNTLLADARIDPWDYGTHLQEARRQLVDTLGEPMSVRLRATWQGAAARASDGLIIKADFAGKQEGTKRALSTLEQTTEMLVRAQAAEADPGQRGVIGQQIRDLHAGYVSSGLLSPQDAQHRLTQAHESATVHGYDAWIRADPDGALAQLEQGLGANPDVPLTAYTKLVDQARQVQRERFQWGEAQEAKVRRDTLLAQKDAEAVAFGTAQQGQLSRAGLDQLRDSRAISPDGYETLVRYLDTKAREDRAEARARESLGLQRAEAGHRETEARLSILATTGELDQAGIVAFARTHRLPARAIDGAMAQAEAHRQAQQSQFGREHHQGEQLLRSAFFKGPFDSLEPIAQQAFADALDEYTRRSKAYPGGREDPIAVVQELIPRYKASIDQDAQTRLEGVRTRLKFASPDDLEAAKPTLPPTLYDEQRRLFKQVADLTQRLAPKPAKPAERGRLGEVWDWIWEPPGKGRAAPDTSGLEGR